MPLYVSYTVARSLLLKMSATTNTAVIVDFNDWVPSQLKYMPPRVNDKGGKSISVISTQSSRALAVSTPWMKTWGIKDFVNEEGVSDGKFKLELQFPSEQYNTPEAEMLLVKLKEFEQKVIDDAVLNSELWWGKKKSRELVEDAFFPFLKYPKDEKKNPDLTKAPGMKPKMPVYNNEWKTRVFDVDYKSVFPNKENPDATPLDFVPKSSDVICGLKCNGVWIGGKGWGLTWQVEQIIVKPKVVNTVNNDICHLRVSDSDRAKLGKTSQLSIDIPERDDSIVQPPAISRAKPESTEVPNSDDEGDSPVEEVVVDQTVSEAEPEVIEESEPVPETETAPTPAVPVVKKIVKKIVPAVEAPVVEAAAPVPAVKKVIKKKV